MPTEKRERQRAGKEARRAAAMAARRRRQRRNQAISIVALVAVIAGIGLIFSQTGPKKTVSTTGSTVKAGDPFTGVKFGTQTCPPADGSAKRQTAFDGPPKKCIDAKLTYTATFETDAGTFAVKLDPKKAPFTVNNFVVLARYHYFDGVPFHRVIPDFVLQGGDAEKGDGTGGPGYTFRDELPKPGDYKAGSLAMANSGPDTNGSQFFVVTSAAGAKTLVQAVGGSAKYSLFGQVTSGMDIVKAIEADGDTSGTPKVVHKMVKVTVVES